MSVSSRLASIWFAFALLVGPLLPAASGAPQREFAW
jgi:hypothetical protein